MTTPTKPQDRKPKTAKPSEVVDADQEARDVRAELLADMPALRPAHRFRLGHRNAFTNLSLDALKSGAFDGNEDGDGVLSFDQSNPEDIARLQKLNAFVASIDEWAETIAEDKVAYAEWAEGKTQEHFMALFVEYRDSLGESSSSES